MALYARLIGIEKPKISPHALIATVAEFKRGNITAAQGRTALGLSAAEGTELQTLMARVPTPLSVDEVEQVLYLAEKGLFYGTEAALKTRLGV